MASREVEGVHPWWTVSWRIGNNTRLYRVLVVGTIAPDMTLASIGLF